ncbi:MAG: YebC/PmpR family DNA-binding transcriptional regulator [Phycisphaeraceae bacterium]
MAGHSKWANIKHRKARQDAKKGKQWSKCSKAIMVAARSGGGDPETNLALRYAIDEAKAVNMPKDTIANAIKKGTGELGANSYERVVYEGYGPNGVAVMIDSLTDNRNRTAPQLRKIFEGGGGNLGASGCVSYLFQNKGEIYVAKAGEGADEEAVMSAALEAGAEDFADEEEAWRVVTDPDSFQAVRDALEAADMQIESAELTMIPDNTVTCTGSDAEKVMRFIDNLEDHDDVQKVFANFEIPDEEMAGLEG